MAKYSASTKSEKFTRIALSQVVNFGRPLDLKSLFQYLTAQIHQKNYKNTLIIISQVSIRLYKALTERDLDLHEADLELLKTDTYCTGPYLEKILNLKKNPKLVLFNQQTFRFIYYLLVHDINYFENEVLKSRSDSSFIVETFDNFSLLGVFLIANEILSQLEASTISTAEESVEIRDFYSRCLVDPAGAIGRSDLLYNQPYFNNELKSRFNLSVLDLRQMTFDHFVHVVTKDPAIIAPRSLLKLPQEKNILDLISVPYKRKSIQFTELVSNLGINLAIGKETRGKPLIEVDGLYYCVCPELLGGVLSDIPHHAIFTDMLAKKENTNSLHDQRGLAFHKYIKTLSEIVLGKQICKEVAPKKQGEFGDIIIDLNSEEKLMVEFKVADPRDSVKKGNLTETIKRFLLPQERKKGGKRSPGPLQVMERAMEFREKYQFKGKMHTAVAYYGWFPEVDEFDLAYARTIKTNTICVKYEKDSRNFSTILLNSMTWELMLSAVIQLMPKSHSPQDIIFSLIEVLKPQAQFPSQSSAVIEEYFLEHKIKFSVASLFRKEIHDLAEDRKVMITSLSKAII